MTNSPYTRCQFLLGEVARVKTVLPAKASRGLPLGFRTVFITVPGKYRCWSDVPRCNAPTFTTKDGKRLSYCAEHCAVCYTAYDADAAKQLNAAATYATRLPGSAGTFW